MVEPGSRLTVVALHGFDDDPAALGPRLQGWLGAAGLDAVAVVTPTGPVATESGRRAWWTDDGAEVPAALAAVGRAVEEAGSGGAVALFGYSQGAALALTFGLARPGPGEAALAGLAVVAGFLPPVLEPPIDAGHLAGARILVAHGSEDEVVPVQSGRSLSRMLARSGLDVTTTERDVGHDLDPFAPDVVAWVRAVAAD